MLQFVELVNLGERTILHVTGTRLDDVDALVDALVQRGFILTHVDGDSVYAQIEGDYEKILNIMQDLKTYGLYMEGEAYKRR